MATMTCGTCNASWDDEVFPTPAGRCPFEYDHVEEPEPVLPEIAMYVSPRVDNAAVIAFARPGRVEVFVVDGVLHAHVYEGALIDLDQEPLFAYDGTLPVNVNCSA
jgi:hypothetical protein